jgi:hypothetical protein
MSGLFNKFNNVDERFIMHRYYSTRWAIMVGVLMMAAWLLYDFYFNDNLQVDLMVILGAIALTKVTAMLYFRATQ